MGRLEGERKTIYVKREDLGVWRRAAEKWAGSMSSLLAELLRRYVEGGAAPGDPGDRGGTRKKD